MKLIRYYKSLSVPLKAAIWFTVVNFLTKGISFFSIPFFTNVLSTEEYGKVSVFLTYQDIIINFATFEMYSGAYIRGILRYKEDISFFSKSEQMLSTIITLFVFLISIPLMPWLISKAEINVHVYYLMYIYFLVFPAYQCWVEKKRFDYDYKPVVISAVLYTALSTIIPLIAVFRIEPSSYIRIVYMLIPEIVFCIPFYLKNIQISGLLKNKQLVAEQWKFLLSFQAPSVVHAMSYILLSSADKIMIGAMIGNSEAGIYSIAVTLASVISILCMSVNQVLKPWRYQRMECKDYLNIKKKSNVLLIGFGLLVILWILIAPDVLKLFFKPDYYPAIWVIPPVSMSVFFVFLYSMFVNIEEYYYQTKYTMFATSISAVVNIIMNWFLIRIWGYIACAYTTLGCYILLAVLHLYWASKAAKKNNNSITTMFNIKFICAWSLFLVAFQLLITITYSIDVVRYGLVVVLAVVGICYSKKIVLLIKELIKK